MIASILTLSPEEFQSLGKYHDDYTIHKLVYSLFPGSQRKFLFLDRYGDFNSRKILMVSQENPQNPAFGRIEIKTIPENFLKAQSYAFEVRLNPVKRANGNKKMIPVTGIPYLTEWFLGKQKNWGFNANPERLEIFDTGIQEIAKDKNTTILHNKATFRGVLQVTESKKFQESFRNGIGRGKAFGFGLLQLQPLK